MDDKGTISQGIQGGFVGIASAFVSESLSNMIPWLIVMLMVILTDLAFGIRKSIYRGEEVRFSHAVRATMGKMVTYFAFVVMVCMINTAMGETCAIHKWSCLLVCFIEGCSIIGNYLKPKGVDLNLVGVLRILANKIAKVDKEEIEKIITDEKEGKHEEGRD